MSKRIRHILYAFSGIILLVCIMLFVKKLTGNVDSITEDETFYLMETQVGNVSEVNITNEYGAYTIKREAEEYVLEEISGFEQNTERIEELFSIAAKLQYDEVLSGAGNNLGEYGLDEPWGKCVITYSDGFELSLDIGLEAPNYNGGRYVKMAGSNDIYVLTSTASEMIGLKAAEFVSPVVIAPSDVGTKISEMRLTGSGRTEDILIKSAEDTGKKVIENYDYIIYEPCTVPTNPYTGDDAANLPLNGLTALKAIEIHPSDVTIAEYGLQSPAYAVEYAYNGEFVRLYFSWYDEHTGTMSCMSDGGEVIYLIDHATIEWIDAPLYDLAYEYLFEADISQVSKLICDTTDGQYVFEIRHTQTDAIEVYGNGAKIDDADNFEKIFKLITNVQWDNTVEGINGENAESEFSFTVEYLPELQLESDTVRYIKISDRKYFIEVNGTGSFTTLVSDVNGRIDNILDSVQWHDSLGSAQQHDSLGSVQ